MSTVEILAFQLGVHQSNKSNQIFFVLSFVWLMENKIKEVIKEEILSRSVVKETGSPNQDGSRELTGN